MERRKIIMRTINQIPIPASLSGRRVQLLFNPRYNYLHKQERFADFPPVIYYLSYFGLFHQSAVQAGFSLSIIYAILSHSKVNRIFQRISRSGLPHRKSIMPTCKACNDVQSHRLKRQGLKKAVLYIPPYIM